MRRTRALLAAALLAGCTCEGAPPSPQTPPVSSEVPPAAPPSATSATLLPTTARTDLPAATPAITITVDEREFVVSNRALVGSWPDAEREAVGRTRPLGDAEYPVIEESVDDASDALSIPGLREPMTRVMAIERARAAIVHAEGITTAFALRAAPDVHFARVLAAVFAAALAGLNQPRLVLASPSGECELRLTLPAPAPATGTLAPRLVTLVALDASGLVVSRGESVLAAGCGASRAEGSTDPTLPTASITPSAIDACLAAIGAPGTLVFRAPGTTRYADAVAVLETLAAHGDVDLAGPIE